MKQLNSNEWIEHFLAEDPPRSKSLVMTIFGDAVAPHGGTIWLGSLIELLAPFGVNDRLLRTSVFRLAQEGWLVPTATAGAARTRSCRRRCRASSAPTAASMRAAQRALGRQLDAAGMSAGGAIDAPQRTQLRKELLWEGYAHVAPGVFAHPAGNAEVLEDILVRLGVQGKLFICRATKWPGVSSRPLPELLAEGWDLSA
jgi:phenylacetic acid degradation operon negative regulatory protein